MSAAKTYWIMSGEASGDDYGAHLAQALRQAEPSCIIRGMGGAKMLESGVDCFIDSTELGVVGFIEVIRHIFLFVKLFRQAVELARQERPDAVVLIDYPGFNLRLAKALKKMGIKVIWYISPQVWAWKRGRVFTLAKCVDRMLCILPFEPQCYSETTLPAEYVGHPLLQTLAPYLAIDMPRDPNKILILPGSRRGELQRLLPHFLRAAAIVHKRHPDLQFEISLPRESTLFLAQEIIKDMDFDVESLKIQMSYGNTRALMRQAVAGMASTGTVMLEAAILGLPLIGAYIMNPITWFLAKRLVKLSYVSLPNLICNRMIYEEFLQKDCYPEALADGVERILPDGSRREEVIAGLVETVEALGGIADVAGKVADIVINCN